MTVAAIADFISFINENKVDMERFGIRIKIMFRGDSLRLSGFY